MKLCPECEKLYSTELTKKEKRLAGLVAEGLTNTEIGEQMGTTRHVIRNYLRPVFDKLGMSTRLEVALWYVHKQSEGKL